MEDLRVNRTAAAAGFYSLDLYRHIAIHGPKRGSVVAIVRQAPPALGTTAASLSVVFNLYRHHLGLDLGKE